MLNNVHYINDLTFLSYNTKESIKKNELPLWTPYFYSGHPLIAIPENYMFDLNFLLIYLFKDIYFAMNFSAIFYFFLAGLGMYILINAIIDNKKGAFISAIIYMFNGYMQSFIMHGHLNILEGYALVPFVFFFVYKAIKSKDWVFYGILAGIFFALQILAGSIILFFYTALIVGAYFLFNLISRNFKKVLIKSVFVGLLAVSVTLGLSAIKLLPVLEFTKMSSRSDKVSYVEFVGEPINLENILKILVTHVNFPGMSAAIGIIALILVLYGLVNYRKKVVVFSLIIMIFSISFASGTFVADVMYKVPGFDKQRHVERSLVLFVFAASILAAYGFASLSEKLKKYKLFAKYEISFFALVIFLILLQLLFLQTLPLPSKIIKPEDIKLLDYISKDASIFRTMNIALREVIGTVGYNYYAQKGISEVKGGGGIWVNDYVTFIAIAQNTLSSKILGILNVKYVISKRELEETDLKLVDIFEECKDCPFSEPYGPYLYKNQNFLPRYYTVPNSVLIVGDNSMVKQAVYNLMLQNLEPKNTVLVEGIKINDYNADFLKRFDIILLLKDSVDSEGISKLREYALQGGVIVPDILNNQNSISNEAIHSIFSKLNGSYTEMKINDYSNNKVVVDLNGQKGWLVASERFAHFSGWKASINGKILNIFKANNAITALYLEGEKGKLVFEYKPNSYRKGKLVSILTITIIIIYLVYYFLPNMGGSNQA